MREVRRGRAEIAEGEANVSPEDKAMQLPVGNTCADCVYVRGCVNMGFTWRTRTMCDFYPNRFLEQPKTDKRADAPRET